MYQLRKLNIWDEQRLCAKPQVRLHVKNRLPVEKG